MLGIDSSTNKSGVSIWENGRYKDCRLIDCSKAGDYDARLKVMSMELWHTLEELNPQIIWIEETVVVRNAQTQRFLTRLQGVIYAWCINNNCEFNTIRPSEWRKRLGIQQGKGIKREQLKAQAIEHVAKKYKVEVGNDEADAICIGEAVLVMYDETKKEVKEKTK